MKLQCIFFGVILFFAACEKKPEQDLLPGWLETIIVERNKDNICYYQRATRYQWNDQYYYELYSPVSSCLLCDVFNESGNRIEWISYEEVEDYTLNRKDETVLWVCEM